MKALVVDSPWIELILAGQKTWEMRKTACHQRGLIALIKKGSGTVVGIAEIAGSLSPLDDPDSYAAAERMHRIPPERQAQAFADGWRTPWLLANAKPLTSHVRYDHPSGAVIWVNLSPHVERAVKEQIGEGEVGEFRAQSALGPRIIPSLPVRKADENRISPPLVRTTEHVPAGTTRDVVVTGGNIRNNHLWLPLDFFPPDAIGGSNKRDRAPKSLVVTFRPGSTIETDIDGTKRILRSRAPVGDFLTRSGIREGDSVRITRTGPYTYDLAKA